MILRFFILFTLVFVPMQGFSAPIPVPKRTDGTSFGNTATEKNLQQQIEQWTAYFCEDAPEEYQKPAQQGGTSPCEQAERFIQAFDYENAAKTLEDVKPKQPAGGLIVLLGLLRDTAQISQEAELEILDPDKPRGSGGVCRWQRQPYVGKGVGKTAEVLNKLPIHMGGDTFKNSFETGSGGTATFKTSYVYGDRCGGEGCGADCLPHYELYVRKCLPGCPVRCGAAILPAGTVEIVNPYQPKFMCVTSGGNYDEAFADVGGTLLAIEAQQKQLADKIAAKEKECGALPFGAEKQKCEAELASFQEDVANLLEAASLWQQADGIEAQLRKLAGIDNRRASVPGDGRGGPRNLGSRAAEGAPQSAGPTLQDQQRAREYRKQLQNIRQIALKLFDSRKEFASQLADAGANFGGTNALRTSCYALMPSALAAMSGEGDIRNTINQFQCELAKGMTLTGDDIWKYMVIRSDASQPAFSKPLDGIGSKKHPIFAKIMAQQRKAEGQYKSRERYYERCWYGGDWTILEESGGNYDRYDALYQAYLEDTFPGGKMTYLASTDKDGLQLPVYAVSKYQHDVDYGLKARRDERNKNASCDGHILNANIETNYADLVKKGKHPIALTQDPEVVKTPAGAECVENVGNIASAFDFGTGGSENKRELLRASMAKFFRMRTPDGQAVGATGGDGEAHIKDLEWGWDQCSKDPNDLSDIGVSMGYPHGAHWPAMQLGSFDARLMNPVFNGMNYETEEGKKAFLKPRRGGTSFVVRTGMSCQIQVVTNSNGGGCCSCWFVVSAPPWKVKRVFGSSTIKGCTDKYCKARRFGGDQEIPYKTKQEEWEI